MNELPKKIDHPLAVGDKVTAKRPSCQCKGARIEEVTGEVRKVIQNQMGWWYYLSTGITVRDVWVSDKVN